MRQAERAERAHMAFTDLAPRNLKVIGDDAPSSRRRRPTQQRALGSVPVDNTDGKAPGEGDRSRPGP